MTFHGREKKEKKKPHMNQSNEQDEIDLFAEKKEKKIIHEESINQLKLNRIVFVFHLFNLNH